MLRSTADYYGVGTTRCDLKRFGTKSKRGRGLSHEKVVPTPTQGNKTDGPFKKAGAENRAPHRRNLRHATTRLATAVLSARENIGAMVRVTKRP